MPARNSIKVYIANGIYHIYNRGINKSDIFCDHQDYSVMLRILKDALLPPPERKMMQIDVTFKGRTFKGVPRPPTSYYDSVDLLAHCLMPNHFHFLLQQKKERIINKFLQSISIRYAMYFNKKYKRIGPIFQSKYKATLVLDDAYLLHVSRYIHVNPQELGGDIVSAYSSYADYLGLRHTPWVKTSVILSYFEVGQLPMMQKHHTYKDFVESSNEDSVEFLGNDTLEGSDL